MFAQYWLWRGCIKLHALHFPRQSFLLLPSSSLLKSPGLLCNTRKTQWEVELRFSTQTKSQYLQDHLCCSAEAFSLRKKLQVCKILGLITLSMTWELHSGLCQLCWWGGAHLAGTAFLDMDTGHSSLGWYEIPLCKDRHPLTQHRGWERALWDTLGRWGWAMPHQISADCIKK